MSWGLLRKSAREIWPATVLFGAALFLVEALLAFVIPRIQGQFSSQLFQLKLVQTILRGMLGTEILPGAGAQTFLTLCWVHPVVLGFAWAHAIVTSTRLPAGEVDRGTIDVLLALPVARFELLVAETVTWLGSTTCVIALGICGNLLGALTAPPGERISPGALVQIGVNLGLVNCAVGSLGFLLSAAYCRRGRALTTVFIVVLASFLLNYLAQFWSPARAIVWLSVLDDYRPLVILQDGVWPWRHLGILAAVSAFCWGAAAFVLERRDLPVN